MGLKIRDASTSTRQCADPLIESTTSPPRHILHRNIYFAAATAPSCIFSAAPTSQSPLSIMSLKKTSYTLMTDKQRIALVKQKQNELRMTHTNLISWAEKHLDMKVNQSISSKTLVRSEDILAKRDNPTDVKRHKVVKYRLM